MQNMTRTLVFAIVIAVTLLFPAGVALGAGPSSPAAAERLDDWLIIGPGGGGAQYYPTVSPVNPDRVFVRCDMTGAYVSLDGGESWRMFCLRRGPSWFLWDPVDENIAYASAVGLYRTTDAGETWDLVYPDPENVTGITTSGDHASDRIATKPGTDGSLLTLAVDPSNSKTLFAAIQVAGKTWFHVSRDWGKTWEKEAELPWGGRRGGGGLYVDPRSPEGNRTIYAVGGSQVSLRQDGKWFYAGPPQGVTGFSSSSLGFPKGDGPPTVYAVSNATRSGGEILGGVFVSDDGGDHWRQSNDFWVEMTGRSAQPPQFRSVATCLTDPTVAYISIRGLNVPGESEPVFGIAKTTDSGKTWQMVIEETTSKISPRVKGAWLNRWYGPDWGENPISMSTAPTNPDILFTTDLGRTMRSVDGLETMEAAYSRDLENGMYTTRGLDVTTCYGVHFDPFDEDSVFISYTDIGLFGSPDGGSSWAPSDVPRDWRNTTYWMVFDPEVKGRVWAVMSSVHDLPRPKMWRQGGAPRASGGVAISSDGGKTFTKSIGGMPATCATNIVLDPESPKDARVLYVTGFGTGVWKSVDGGANWTLKNKGIKGRNPFAWWISRDKNGVLYLIVARASEDGSIGTAEDGALYRSTDGAESWTQIPLPKGTNAPNGLAIDPEDPNRMYLAAWGLRGRGNDTGGGIFLTTDAGKTWKHVQSRYQHVYDITIDPRDPSVLYACGFNSSVLRSDDRGETWTRIKGFNFKWGHRVIPDPKNADRIFVTTFGGSVWYGPAAGDPDANEDIVTPVVKY